MNVDRMIRIHVGFFGWETEAVYRESSAYPPAGYNPPRSAFLAVARSLRGSHMPPAYDSLPLPPLRSPLCTRGHGSGCRQFYDTAVMSEGLDSER